MSQAGKGRSKASGGAGADDLVDRLRAAIPAKARTERRMFGGIGFMLDGHMVAGTFRDALLVRVGKDNNAEALKRPGARPMEMRGRSVVGYVMVDRSSLDDASLKEWLGLALAHVRTLQAKPSAKSGRTKPVRNKGERK